MECRKMVTITLYVRQQKRHWCIEQSFGLCGRGRGWDDLGEWHWNMRNIIYEMSCQSRFNAWYRMLGAGALGWPRGTVLEEGEREEASGWRTHVYLWRIHFDIWQNQYNIVKLKKKKVKKKRPWCWERLRAVEGDYRGWDGWMASLTRWMWVWVNSGSWWWTGRPGVLQFIGSQSGTRLSNWTDWTDLPAAGLWPLTIVRLKFLCWKSTLHYDLCLIQDPV